MPRSFRFNWRSVSRDPQSAVRLGLGALLLANLIAAWFAFQTPGGSLADLESDVNAARKQLLARQKTLEQAKHHLELAQKAREAGDQFLSQFFLGRRTAYSTLETVLADAAKASGVRAKERSFNEELIDGSETLGMFSLNANFEGNYTDLIHFVNTIDRSSRLLIIDQMSAQPQQSGGLAINLKINAFYREEGSE